MLTSERYTQVIMNSRVNRLRWDLPVEPLQVGVLHGAIRLMLIHPDVVQGYGHDFKATAGDLRIWCLDRFREMGFTEEEVQELDSEFAATR